MSTGRLCQMTASPGFSDEVIDSSDYSESEEPAQFVTVNSDSVVYSILPKMNDFYS